MSFLTTAIAVFKMIVTFAPLIEELIQAAEATFNVPQSGKQKLDYVMNELKLVFAAGQQVAVAWDAVTPALSRNIAAKVAELYPHVPASPATSTPAAS